MDVALMVDVGAVDLDELEENVASLLGDPERTRRKRFGGGLDGSSEQR